MPPALLLPASAIFAQKNLTPELLWQIGRVSALGVSKDGKWVLYSVGKPNVADNKTSRKIYMIPVTGGDPVLVSNPDSLLADKNLSPDGKLMLGNEAVKVNKVTGADYYPELVKSNVYIYDELMYRHWDTWEDGKFDHVIISPVDKKTDPVDIMKGQPYDCPGKPFGGDEDYIWSPDGRFVVFVTKHKSGTAYTVSTNTDLFAYEVATGKTRNLTEQFKGYDLAPQFNKKGELAWLSMKRDGYEADKQDIVVSDSRTTLNLTAHQDNIHVEGFRWADNDKDIFFWAPVNGTLQLFSVNYPGVTKMVSGIRQITQGDFDITGIIGQQGNTLFVTRTDMNHAAEIYSVNIETGDMAQLTHVNDAFYAGINLCKTERRFVQTTDNKKMLVWVIYPPGFDPAKKYPTLLYCQGGPQSPLTQFYSFRWNFQLMASQGYIVVAPGRRGMPGYGTKWNEQVSKDWGGQVIKDYLSAIDAVSKEPFVDKNRRGCIGQQAFQAAQLKGIKSRFVFLPDENHWVLSAQNAQVWQHEFYRWLAETLK
ncbi:MAG: S9 family peptidase [Chitinophagaceae bacterium]|nr:S9 family peptidase [Chitinophagaceae bacterium]